MEVDAKSGKGSIEWYRKRAVLGQMTQLHKDTNAFWIWYSDIFGVAMLVIAISGMLMIKKGDYAFTSRGWKLALLGMIFPLIFLFLYPQ